MNTKEVDIVEIALEKLKKDTKITGKWGNNAEKEIDGTIKLVIDGQEHVFNAEVVTELRNHQLLNIVRKAEKYKPFMIIAKNLFPKIKEELRQLNIGYIEVNGNIYAKVPGMMVWVDAHKPLKQEVEKTNRAFTKTGLKVIFQFLLDEQLVNMPYREIANTTEVGLGNINYIIHGLRDMGFLIDLNKNEYKISKKRELLDKWITAYAEKLKPALLIGRFRFLKEDDFLNWKKLKLDNNKTWWGGEPAGDLLTNYLKPAELTLYTVQTRTDLIKKLRLIPDEKGNVKIFKKFWHYTEVNENITPPLLVYADLLAKNDRRCTETAQKIYDELLQDKL
jgi:hypothetical protein